MKTLERQFFRFCCKNINHNCNNIKQLTFRTNSETESESSDSQLGGIITSNLQITDLVDNYVKLHPEVSKNHLYYYINKWAIKYRFIGYETSAMYGWFNFSKLPFEYFQIIPDRIFNRCKAFSMSNLLNFPTLREYIRTSTKTKKYKREG